VLHSNTLCVNLGRATGELVSGNYFQTLGVRAARGRTILPEDDAALEDCAEKINTALSEMQHRTVLDSVLAIA
jgi:hypothetical protein